MTRQQERRVAVLGAGIMGCSTALFLARLGVRVTLIDQAPVAFANASRWNEGKIHLGFLYAGDPSLATARKLIPGGLSFKPLVEELTQSSIDDAISIADEIYLNHRDSVAGPSSMLAYLDQVDSLLREHPDSRHYLTDLLRPRTTALTQSELAEVTGSANIVAGFRVPERSVQTGMIADRFVRAIDGQQGIEKIFGCRVEKIVETARGWQVVAGPKVEGDFDAVVSALWQGQAALDAASGFGTDEPWSYRYRLSLFARTKETSSLPSAVIALGPFGDIKNYNGHDLYLSWYPAGLMVNAANADDVPARGGDVESDVARRTLLELGGYFPEVSGLAARGAAITVNGGWIVAPGRGTLSDADSPLHRRDRFGVRRIGSYFSIDTGKYSSAPWLARRVATEVLG